MKVLKTFNIFKENNEINLYGVYYDVDNNSVYNKDGDNVFELAIIENDIPLVKKLFKKFPIKLNELFNHEYIYIIDISSLNMLKLLVDFGADLNISNKVGETIFSLYNNLDKKEFLFFLIENDINWCLNMYGNLDTTFCEHVFSDEEKLREVLKEKYPEKYKKYQKKYKTKLLTKKYKI